MILKDIDQKTNLNKFEKHGHAAEKQMAFYLKRAFQDSGDVFVINDLRIQMDDEIAQIDHLIIHRFGFAVIESKSVTSEISVNEHGEWIRHYSNYSKGMPSPVNQGIRQIDLLKKFLMANCEHLLEKSFISLAALSKFKYDVFVAISDNGIIKRDTKAMIDGVHKADQITKNIEELISGYARTNDKFFSLKMNCHFRDSAMGKISNFLIKSHKPKNNNDENKKSIKKETYEKVAKWAPKDNAAISKKTEIKPCSKCGSQNIEIAYGRYGYYFKCKKCNGNTAIKLKCEEDSCKVRIRKAKLKFYKECSSCGTSELYFENEEVLKV